MFINFCVLTFNFSGKPGNAANYMKGEKFYRKMPLKIPRLKKDVPAQSENMVKGL
jgi:hypothetical protein